MAVEVEISRLLSRTPRDLKDLIVLWVAQHERHTGPGDCSFLGHHFSPRRAQHRSMFDADGGHHREVRFRGSRGVETAAQARFLHHDVRLYRVTDGPCDEHGGFEEGRLKVEGMRARLHATQRVIEDGSAHRPSIDAHALLDSSHVG